MAGVKPQADRLRRGVLLVTMGCRNADVVDQERAAIRTGADDVDLAGLQELVDAQRQFPVLEFAMLLDTQGRALAHTDRARLGQFVRDLPIKAETVTLARLAELVDVATPVVLNGRPVGWARVGLARRVAIRTGEDIALEGVEALARALESVMAEIEHPDQLE